MNSLRGLSTLLIVALVTLLLCLPLYLMGLLRALTRGRVRHGLDRQMDRIVDYWVGFHRWLFQVLRTTRLSVRWEGADELSRQRWYAVVSNHQSWADILILQNVMRYRVPPLKFFTKRELIWIPLIGVAMWLLGFPYVRRLSREQIAANPSLAELDRKATLDACERFRELPSSVLNFLEGSRFTPAKHAAQQGRFRHLLNPKTGGLSYVVAGLNDKLHKVLDVTISYPAGVPTFWQLLCGECPEVEVLIRCHDLPADVVGCGDADRVRAGIGPWIESLWRDKDNRLAAAREPAN
ncbi:MAG: acetyltransferase [Pseudomonadales bacterium]